MNGPNVVCTACGGPTTLDRPVCVKCDAIMLSGDSVCPHCNSALYPNANVQPANKWGIHLTKNGGYVGECSAGSISEPTTDR